MSWFGNKTSVTKRFELDKPYVVEPGEAVNIPDKLDFAVKRMGLELEPVPEPETEIDEPKGPKEPEVEKPKLEKPKAQESQKSKAKGQNQKPSTPPPADAVPAVAAIPPETEAQPPAAAVNSDFDPSFIAPQ